jgi:hypothetical protein
MNWTNTDRRDRTTEGRTRRAAFNFDQRTTTDLENEAACRLLTVIAWTLGIITTAGLIIATAIYL